MDGAMSDAVTSPAAGQAAADGAAPCYRIAVRALCEFTAKQGDLDLRFTPSPSAQEGIAGHALVAGRRAGGYQTEVALSQQYKQLLVRGRADGYDPGRQRIDEVKTYLGALDRMPDNHRRLHWAQARIYGHLLCRQYGLEQIDVALIYLDIASQKETVLHELHAASALAQFFEQQCERFLAWAEQELAHRRARDAALTALPFAHAEFRSGQRPLAEAVYKANLAGRCLMAQAPTGIGKTIGTLFPVLKACPSQQLDKVFYLAAKSSGRQMALDALTLLGAGAAGLPLRVLELVARDKACEHPELACHGDSCPLARGFYDRLPPARAAAVQAATLDKASLRALALQHEVCPYYLSQDLVRWADVVVGDYNYYFDASALLYGLSVQNQWQVSVLVDEAHNLLPRARAMYTAELQLGRLTQMRAAAPASLKKPFAALHRQWQALCRNQEVAYQVYPEIAEKFRYALQQACGAILDYFAQAQAGAADAPAAAPEAAEAPDTGEHLQRFYFDALHFLRMDEVFGSHALFDIAKERGEVVLCIRNVIPAPFLTPRFAASRSTVLFSATLSPAQFYADTLGLPDDAARIEVDSPFSHGQLTVRVQRDISTRYRDRDASLLPIVALVAEQYDKVRGNYLAFFSSYDYLQKVLALFRQHYPEIPVWEQQRHMDEAGQSAFLQRFCADGSGIGFAVLGGAFAEGIDLPGQRLIGAFIATLGLPQVNPVNEEIMRRMNHLFGQQYGYDYTYLFPGIQKVVQAAGRVIRTVSDRGVIHLIDDRYARAAVQRLLPRWWKADTTK